MLDNLEYNFNKTISKIPTLGFSFRISPTHNPDNPLMNPAAASNATADGLGGLSPPPRGEKSPKKLSSCSLVVILKKKFN